MRYFIVMSRESTMLVLAADMVDAGDIAHEINPDMTTIMSFELFIT
jgi:hypothetical protein